MLTDMPALLAALDAFVQEHRRCGEVDARIEGTRVWMTCDCGAVLVRSTQADDSPLARPE